ncbi:MAG TPA: hypothetical protein VM600_10000 [Actinomycetota bacterium]|nr:hypothetical protein [Actinomycetota bacterium]
MIWRAIVSRVDGADIFVRVPVAGGTYEWPARASEHVVCAPGDEVIAARVIGLSFYIILGKVS